MLIYLNLCLHFFLQCYFYPMLPFPPFASQPWYLSFPSHLFIRGCGSYDLSHLSR